MEKKEKPKSDWLLNGLEGNLSQEPDKLKSAGVDFVLLDKEDYINSKDPVIQSAFKKEDGSFDNEKLDKAYPIIKKAYEDFEAYNLTENAVIGRKSLGSPVAKLIGAPEIEDPISFKYTDDPFKAGRSVKSLNDYGIPTESASEIAQKNRLYDYDKGEWMKKTAEEGLAPWDAIFDPRVMARWDKDGIHTDRNGNTVAHNKGDKKTDPLTGSYYYEKLGNRNLGETITERDVLSSFNVLTKEGSWLNKVDFFDSDDKQKSVVGNLVKAGAQIAPYFIPKFKMLYAGAQAVLAGSEALATIGKASMDGFFSNEERANSDLYKFFDKWRAGTNATKTTTDEYGQENPWTSLAGYTGLVTDVVGQLRQQGAVANFSRAFTKGLKSGEKITSGAAKAYMVATQSQGIYDLAEEMGLPPEHKAGLLAGSTVAFGLVMATPLGDYFIRQPKETNVILNNELRRVGASVYNRFKPQIETLSAKYGADSAPVKKLLNRVGEEMAFEAKDSTLKKVMGSLGNNWLTANIGKAYNFSKDAVGKVVKPGTFGFKDTIDEQTGVLIENNIKQYAGAYLAESAEETAELLIGESAVKLAYNGLLDRGFITQEDPKKKKFSFENFGSELLSTALAGGLGGVVGQTLKKQDNRLNDKVTADLMKENGIGEIALQYIKNGRLDELKEQIEEVYENGHFGTTNFSAYRKDKDGTPLPISKNDVSVGEVVKNSVLNYVDQMETLYNNYSNRMMTQDELEQFNEIGILTDPLETLKIETLHNKELADRKTSTDEKYNVEKERLDNEIKNTTNEEEKVKLEAEKLQLTNDYQQQIQFLDNQQEVIDREVSNYRKLFVDDDGFLKSTKPFDYTREVIRHTELEKGVLFDPKGQVMKTEITDKDGVKKEKVLQLKDATQEQMISHLTTLDKAFKNSKIGSYSTKTGLEYSNMTEEELRNEIVKKNRGRKVYNKVFSKKVLALMQGEQLKLIEQLNEEYVKRDNLLSVEQTTQVKENLEKVNLEINNLEAELETFNNSERKMKVFEKVLLSQRTDLLSHFKNEEGIGIFNKNDLAKKIFNGTPYTALSEKQKAQINQEYIKYIQGDTTYGDYAEHTSVSMKEYNKQARLSKKEEVETLADTLSKLNTNANQDAIVAAFTNGYLRVEDNIKGFNRKLSQEEKEAIFEAIKNNKITDDVKDTALDSVYKKLGGKNIQVLEDVEEDDIPEALLNIYKIEDLKNLYNGVINLKSSKLSDLVAGIEAIPNYDYNKIKDKKISDIKDKEGNNLDELLGEKLSLDKKNTFADFIKKYKNASKDIQNELRLPLQSITFKIEETTKEKAERFDETMALYEPYSKFEGRDLLKELLAAESKSDIIEEFINQKKSKKGETIDDLINRLTNHLEREGVEGFIFNDEDVAKNPIEELLSELQQLAAVTEGLHENNQILNATAKKLGLKGKPYINTYTRNVIFNRLKNRVKKLEFFKDLLENNSKDLTGTIKKGDLLTNLTAVSMLINLKTAKYGEDASIEAFTGFDEVLSKPDMTSHVETVMRAINKNSEGTIGDYLVKANDEKFVSDVVPLYQAFSAIENAWFEYYNALSDESKKELEPIFQQSYNVTDVLEANVFTPNNFITYLRAISNESADTFRTKLSLSIGTEEEAEKDVRKRKNKFAPIYTQYFALRVLSAAENQGITETNFIPLEEKVSEDYNELTLKRDAEFGSFLLPYTVIVDDNAGAGKTSVNIKNKARMSAYEGKRIGLFASGDVQLNSIVNDLETDENVKDVIEKKGTIVDYFNLISSDLMMLRAAVENNMTREKELYFMFNGVQIPKLFLTDTNNHIRLNTVAVQKAVQALENTINHEDLSKLDVLFFDEATNMSEFEINVISQLIAKHNEQRKTSVPLTLTLMGDSTQQGYRVKDENGDLIESDFSMGSVRAIKTPRGKITLRGSYNFLNDSFNYFNDAFTAFRYHTEVVAEGIQLKRPKDYELLKPHSPQIFRGLFQKEEELIGAGFFKTVEEANEKLNLKPIVEKVKKENKKIIVIVGKDKEDDAMERLSPLLNNSSEFNDVFRILIDDGTKNSVQGSQADYVFHLSSTVIEKDEGSGKHIFTMLSRAKKAYVHINEKLPFHTSELFKNTYDSKNGLLKLKSNTRPGYIVNETEVITNSDKVKSISKFSLDTEEGRNNVEELYSQAIRLNASLSTEEAAKNLKKPKKLKKDKKEELPIKGDSFASNEQKRNFIFYKNQKGKRNINLNLFYSEDEEISAKKVIQRRKLINDNDEAIVKFTNNNHQGRGKNINYDGNQELAVYINDTMIGILTSPYSIRENIEKLEKSIAEFKKHTPKTNKETEEVKEFIEVFEASVKQLQETLDFVEDILQKLEKDKNVTLDISDLNIKNSDLKSFSKSVFKEQKNGEIEGVALKNTGTSEKPYWVLTEDGFKRLHLNQKNEAIVYHTRPFTVVSDIGDLEVGTPYVAISSIDGSISNLTVEQLENQIEKWKKQKPEDRTLQIIPLRQSGKIESFSDVFKKLVIKMKNRASTDYGDISGDLNSLFTKTQVEKITDILHDVFFNAEGKIRESLRNEHKDLSKLFNELEKRKYQNKFSIPALVVQTFKITSDSESKKFSDEEFQNLIDGYFKVIGTSAVTDDMKKLNSMLKKIDDIISSSPEGKPFPRKIIAKGGLNKSSSGSSEVAFITDTSDIIYDRYFFVPKVAVDLENIKIKETMPKTDNTEEDDLDSPDDNINDLNQFGKDIKELDIEGLRTNEEINTLLNAFKENKELDILKKLPILNSEQKENLADIIEDIIDSVEENKENNCNNSEEPPF